MRICSVSSLPVSRSFFSLQINSKWRCQIDTWASKRVVENFTTDPSIVRRMTKIGRSVTRNVSLSSCFTFCLKRGANFPFGWCVPMKHKASYLAKDLTASIRINCIPDNPQRAAACMCILPSILSQQGNTNTTCVIAVICLLHFISD